MPLPSARLLAATLLLAVAPAAAPPRTPAEPAQITPWESRMRHQFAQDYGIPETYAKMKNPLPNDPQTWALGAAVYTNQCASCHGLSGEGKGPRAPGLATPPANLAWFATLPQSKWDGFIYWTVAEGGEPFGTAMPAYKAKLTDKEIWAVTVFMRHTLGTTRRS